MCVLVSVGFCLTIHESRQAYLVLTSIEVLSVEQFY